MATTPEINCETKMAATPEKQTKLVMVKQGNMDCLLKECGELARRPGPVQSDRESYYRRIQVETVALLKKMREEDDAMLHQFDAAMGRAMQEIEIRDDDEGDDEDEGGSSGDKAEEAMPGAVAGHGVCKL